MSFKYGASITQRYNLIYKNEKTASIECVGRQRKEFAKLNGLAPHFVIRHNKEENGGGIAKLWKCALNTALMRGMQFCGGQTGNKIYPSKRSNPSKNIVFT